MKLAFDFNPPHGAITEGKQMRKIGIGAFLANAIVYLAVVAFVASVIYRSLKPDDAMKFEFFGVALRSEVVLVALFFVMVIVQRNLSAARGFGRIVDWLISASMLVVVAPAVAIWANSPFVEGWVKETGDFLGATLDPSSSDFKGAVALIFGVFALLDVFGRDLFGFFRGGSGAGMSVAGGSTFETSVTPRVKLNSPWDLELPNGRVMQFTPPPEMLERFESEVARRLPNPGTPPAAGT